MSIVTRMPSLSLALLVVLLTLGGHPAAALSPAGNDRKQEVEVVSVWPGDGLPPGETGELGPETEQPIKSNDPKPVRRLTNIVRPTLHLFRPALDKDTGAAVVIAPGGGYNILAWDLEGEEVAKWLNTVGVTGIVLKYRVPRRPGQPAKEPPIQPLQDAQRALRVVRANASEWGLDPTRIGMLGFSAGGHLTASAATRFEESTYAPLDDLDKLSCRPDFVVLVYPAYLQKADAPLVVDGRLPVGKQTPPTFLVHAGDDPLTPLNSVAFYTALKRNGVAAELHIYETGGHGFGLRPTQHPSSTWPDRCAAWLQAKGWLQPKPKAKDTPQ